VPNGFPGRFFSAPLTDFLGDATPQHRTLCDGPVETARLIRTAYLRNL
jgi:hypothetical protein